jgi:hypothetical protein
MLKVVSTVIFSSKNLLNFPSLLTKTYIRTFLATSFIVTPCWKPPRCPSIGEWVIKTPNLWYIHTMEYYLAVKTNKSQLSKDIEES